MTEFAKSVRVEKLRMSATGCYNALPGTTSDSPCLRSLGWTSGHRGPLLRSGLPSFCPQLVPILVL